MIVSPRTPTDAANLGETALRASAVETVWREMRLRRAGLEATVADMIGQCEETLAADVFGS